MVHRNTGEDVLVELSSPFGKNVRVG